MYQKSGKIWICIIIVYGDDNKDQFEVCSELVEKIFVFSYDSYFQIIQANKKQNGQLLLLIAQVFTPRVICNIDFLQKVDLFYSLY